MNTRARVEKIIFALLKNMLSVFIVSVSFSILCVRNELHFLFEYIFSMLYISFHFLSRWTDEKLTFSKDFHPVEYSRDIMHHKRSRPSPQAERKNAVNLRICFYICWAVITFIDSRNGCDGKKFTTAHSGEWIFTANRGWIAGDFFPLLSRENTMMTTSSGKRFIKICGNRKGRVWYGNHIH